jgi:hypothetical protein
LIDKFAELDDESSVDEDILSDEELDDIIDSERRNFNSRFSISNPELTNDQLKNIFPELSPHWR